MHQYIMPFVGLTLEMAPYLLLGFLFAGILHSVVPRTFYMRYLSGRNFRSVFYAAAIGVPLPLCSCGVIPTAMSLRRNGASSGATVSFLIATPQTGVDSILATASLMGWPMAVIRPIAALVTAIFGGACVNAASKEDAEPILNADNEELPKGWKAKVIDTLHYGFVDMMQDIGKWLVIGLLIAGLITILVPDNFFDVLNGYPMLNMLVVLAIAVPMYVCATGSIPIAVALMLKGLSPGAALVFLMAGPATNMAAIMVINKVLHRRPLLIYLGSIVAGAMLFGLAIDAWLPADIFTSRLSHSCCSMHEFPIWKIVSAVVFVILLINAFVIKHNHNHNIQETMQETVTNTTRFIVTGMSCNHCRANVERALSAMPEVESCDVNLETGVAVVAGAVDPDAICQCVEGLGYGCKVEK